MFRRERVLAYDKITDTAVPGVHRGFDWRVACGDPNTLKPRVSTQAHQDLVGLEHLDMAHPVRSPVVRRSQQVHFKAGDLQRRLLVTNLMTGWFPARTPADL